MLASTTNKEEAIADVIHQALNHNYVFVFGELLDTPNVLKLEQSKFKGVVSLLRIFAYGTLLDYKENKASLGLPDLTQLQLQKLKKLTIVSAAAEKRMIPYHELQEKVDIKNVRELEDMIIDCIYQGLIKGKLDQKSKHLEIDFAIGRDLRPGQIQLMKHVLSEWCDRSDLLLRTLEEKIVQAVNYQERQKEHKTAFEKRIEDLRASLKVAMEAEMNENPELQEEDPRVSRRKLPRKGPPKKGKSPLDFMTRLH